LFGKHVSEFKLKKVRVAVGAFPVPHLVAMVISLDTWHCCQDVGDVVVYLTSHLFEHFPFFEGKSYTLPCRHNFIHIIRQTEFTEIDTLETGGDTYILVTPQMMFKVWCRLVMDVANFLIDTFDTL
jgi:hypothetical protein